MGEYIGTTSWSYPTILKDSLEDYIKKILKEVSEKTNLLIMDINITFNGEELIGLKTRLEDFGVTNISNIETNVFTDIEKPIDYKNPRVMEVQEQRILSILREREIQKKQEIHDKQWKQKRLEQWIHETTMIYYEPTDENSWVFHTLSKLQEIM